MRTARLTECPCGAEYDPYVYTTCISCSTGEPRPHLMEECVLCDRAIREGETVWTDGLPASSICRECATKHNILDFPCVTMTPGKVWTRKDIRAFRNIGIR